MTDHASLQRKHVWREFEATENYYQKPVHREHSTVHWLFHHRLIRRLGEKKSKGCFPEQIHI